MNGSCVITQSTRITGAHSTACIVIFAAVNTGQHDNDVNSKEQCERAPREAISTTCSEARKNMASLR